MFHVNGQKDLFREGIAQLHKGQNDNTEQMIDSDDFQEVD
jgi:hypothetical protein